VAKPVTPNERKEAIIAALKENGSITASEAAKLFGLESSRDRDKRTISLLLAI
jgi:predicted HTH transcriptional regulator